MSAVKTAIMGKFLESKWQANLSPAVSDSCRLGLPKRNYIFSDDESSFSSFFTFFKRSKKTIPFFHELDRADRSNFRSPVRPYKITKDEKETLLKLRILL